MKILICAAQASGAMASCVIAAAVLCYPIKYVVHAQQGGSGITVPTTLPPFDRNAAKCAQPPNLQKTLTFAQDNEREFMLGARRGMERAARDRGLAFNVLLASNDSARMLLQVGELASASPGAVIAAPVDAPSLAPALQQIIWSGAYVGTIVPPPATSLLNAPQYLTGKALGDAAASYIKDQLRGSAKVVILTHDSLQFLAPRFTAMRDALQDLPGVTIVADISPTTVDKAGGAAMMRTILIAQPDIDVVLGADTVVLGALEALRAARKTKPTQFFGGIDGEPEAISEIKNGGPYKVSVSLASPVFGYVMGQHAADWLEGKAVPQALDTLPIALTAANIAQFESDIRDPASVYNDAARLNRYMKLYGGICYDTRDRYINFPWSSERN